MTAMYLRVKASDKFVEISGVVFHKVADRPCDPGTNHRRLVPTPLGLPAAGPDRKERP
jgi:hypothetical protein